MRTRWAMTQIDHAQRVLEHLAILAHQRGARFVPKDGPMFKTIEAVQAYVLEIGAIQLENRPERKSPLTNSVLPVRDGPFKTRHFFLGCCDFVASASHSSPIGQRGKGFSSARLAACAFEQRSCTNISRFDFCIHSKSASRRQSPFPQRTN